MSFPDTRRAEALRQDLETGCCLGNIASLLREAPFRRDVLRLSHRDRSHRVKAPIVHCLRQSQKVAVHRASGSSSALYPWHTTGESHLMSLSYESESRRSSGRL